MPLHIGRSRSFTANAIPLAGKTLSIDAPFRPQPLKTSVLHTLRSASTNDVSLPTCSRMRARSSGAIAVFDAQPARPPQSTASAAVFFFAAFLFFIAAVAATAFGTGNCTGAACVATAARWRLLRNLLSTSDAPRSEQWKLMDWLQKMLFAATNSLGGWLQKCDFNALPTNPCKHQATPTYRVAKNFSISRMMGMGALASK